MIDHILKNDIFYINNQYETAKQAANEVIEAVLYSVGGHRG